MKKTAKTMMLHRETLRALTADPLAQAAAGAATLFTCPTACATRPVTCQTCGAMDTCAVC